MRSSSSINAQSYDRSLWFIALFVISAHILLLILTEFYVAAPATLKPPKKRALIVQTVTLEPPRPQPPAQSAKTVTVAEPVVSAPQVEIAPVEAPAPPPVEPEAPKQETVKQPEKKAVLPKPQPKPPAPVPAPKKTVQKKAPPKKAEIKPKAKETPKKETSKPKPAAKPAPKKAPEVKPKTPPKQSAKTDPQAEAAKAKQAAEAKAKAESARIKAEADKSKRLDLIASAQKSIAKMERSSGTLTSSSTSSAAVPGKIESLAVETFPEGSSLSEREITYYDELASRLKVLLRLPEYGEVRIKLTLDRSGKFVKVAIVSAESSANKKYIEKTLPTLKYPSFGNNFTGMLEYTFVISLSNS